MWKTVVAILFLRFVLVPIQLPADRALELSGLIGTANYPDMHKIRTVGFFFEYRLHWQFEVRPLLSTVCTCV
jgi:hypothetical protein